MIRDTTSPFSFQTFEWNIWKLNFFFLFKFEGLNIKRRPPLWWSVKVMNISFIFNFFFNLISILKISFINFSTLPPVNSPSIFHILHELPNILVSFAWNPVTMTTHHTFFKLSFIASSVCPIVGAYILFYIPCPSNTLFE